MRAVTRQTSGRMFDIVRSKPEVLAVQRAYKYWVSGGAELARQMVAGAGCYSALDCSLFGLQSSVLWAQSGKPGDSLRRVVPPNQEHHSDTVDREIFAELYFCVLNFSAFNFHHLASL